jgi:hypothetical protein
LRGDLRVGLFLGQIGDQHVGALTSESQRHGAADATVAACDERALALQSPAADVRIFAVVDWWLHPALETRRLLRGS